MKKYPELDKALEQNELKKEVYLPSSFWKRAMESVCSEIEEFGVENFRQLKTPLSYFVPNYGIPANSFNENIKNKLEKTLEEEGTKKQKLAMEEFLSGYFHALSDYRVFVSADKIDKKPFLNDFSESNYGNPVEQFEFDGKKYSRSSLNYIQGLCFLKKYLDDKEAINTVMEIGGGFGTLGEILKYSGDVKYINIDIPPVSYIAWNYLKNIYSEDIEPYTHQREEIVLSELKSCSVFNSWDIEKMKGSIDLFVNFISFQEMEPHIVSNYLKYVMMLNPTWVLLRNMREGKQVKKAPTDIGVEIPILKDDYINMLKDQYSLIANNIIPFGYKTVDGYHSELYLFKRKNV